MKLIVAASVAAIAVTSLLASASLADPVKHMMASRASQQCVDDQQVARKADGQTLRDDFTRCRTETNGSPSGAPDPDQVQ